MIDIASLSNSISKKSKWNKSVEKKVGAWVSKSRPRKLFVTEIFFCRKLHTDLGHLSEFIFKKTVTKYLDDYVLDNPDSDQTIIKF